ncbi:cysteine dioxygenase family protein [Stenotrophomonas sp. SY1]|uniref:cysteine dioxygenase family protein n=1 Tax=Stenotrophomonas sp. SY1 TaxID=477235 RepID=UPI001E4BEF0F|nr:cysteine dioxygenase family protein [Stenotrophomonas sp. SY1]MCD9088479.1 cysteine dioxygenase family protein [Stenotrophomonas sp. SY1]
MRLDISQYPDFPGRQHLLDGIDHAVCATDAATTVSRVQQVLERAINDPRISLPASVHAPVSEHYARRELYRSPTHGYSIIAMTWGPAQGTPLHDHDGLWCVEGVWRGALDITPYQLVEREGEQFRFAARQCLHGCRGSAGNLIPPDEFHTLHNARSDDIAVSVHVYQRLMQRSHIFEPLPEKPQWYQRQTRCLALDA